MLTDLPIMLPAYPEIFLLAAGCAILVIDLDEFKTLMRRKAGSQ